MAHTDIVTITPHADVELGWKRQDIEVFVTVPEGEVGEGTGLILVLGDLGEKGDSQRLEELRVHLADEHDCVTVSVNYFGVFREEKLEISTAFFHNLERIYGWKLTELDLITLKNAPEFYGHIASRILSKGVFNLDLRCQPILANGRGEYESWGFLPALDHLVVLGELLKRYELNRERLMLYGMGYGGYVALLAGKFAPRTFSLIAERGGYCRSMLRHIVGGEILDPDKIIRISIQNSPLSFSMAACANNPWTIEDEQSPHFFSDTHRRIRNLLDESHRVESPTRYALFHSEQDEIASVEDKEQCAGLLTRFSPVRFLKVREDDIGGGVFTNLTHNLGGNDPAIFNLALNQSDWPEGGSDGQTDFDRSSRYEFDCGPVSYVFEYSPEGLEAKVRRDGDWKTVIGDQ